MSVYRQEGVGHVSRHDAKTIAIDVIRQTAITFGLIIFATFILMLLQNAGFSVVNFIVLYLLSVLVTSRYTKGYAYGILASVISALSFNFFFLEPVYTFKVSESTYLFTFIVMLIASIFSTTLAGKLVQSKELAGKRENQSHILNNIISTLAKTSEIPEAAAAAQTCLSDLFRCDAACIITMEDSRDHCMDQHESEMTEQYSIPITIHDQIIGFVRMPKEFENADKETRMLLDSVLMQINIAMERILLIREKEAAKSEIERERFKSNLLRAISHDLRTPLARISGAAEMLSENIEDESIGSLADSIYEDSTWLTRLVENILSLTRIQEGKIAVNIRQEAIEEIIAETIERVNKYYPGRKVFVSVPDEVLFVPMDGKLIEQVLINLLSNAAVHTEPNDEIRLSVWQEEDGKVWFKVADTGIGIAQEDLPKVFDMFFVGMSRTSGKRGMGLGLAICRAIVELHGGEIFAENNPSGGAIFRFYLNQ
jgi:two-component system sensor histidine kinase KdpD